MGPPSEKLYKHELLEPLHLEGEFGLPRVICTVLRESRWGWGLSFLNHSLPSQGFMTK